MAGPLHRIREHDRRAGFNLIGLSILMTAAAWVLASQLPGREAGDNLQKAATTAQKMAKIEQQTIGFMLVNQRRPCPADGQYTTSSQLFGIEAGPPGSCTGSTLASVSTISGVTQASPGVITDTAHGLAVGNAVTISGVAGMTNLNGGYYTVATVVDANHFTLNNLAGGGVNTSGFSAYTSGGTVTPVSIAAPLSMPTTSITGVTKANPGVITDTAHGLAVGNVVTISGITGYYNMTTLDGGYYIVGTVPDANHFTLTDLYGNTVNTTNYPSYTSGGTVTFASAVGGVVPTKSLGLDDSYAFDEWGRRITYIVDPRATNSKSCRQMMQPSPNFTTRLPFTPGIAVESSTGGTVIDNVMAAYVSHGPDGHGAWPAYGSANGALTATQSRALRVNNGSTDTDQLTNASVNSSFGLAFSNVKVQKEPTATFDDRTYYMDYLKNTCCIGFYCYNYGFQAYGNASAGGLIGISVAVGDVNGDGIPDLLIAATASNNGGGTIYVVFGTVNGFPNPLPLDSLNGSNGFILKGVNNGDYIGSSVTTGDVNGDGYADIIIGSGSFPQYGGLGATYVVYGGPTRKGGTAWAASYILNPGGSNLINGIDGFRLDGVTGGAAVGATGDINKDGYADLIIGAWKANSNAGYTYVMYGNATTMQTTTVSTTSGSTTATVASYTGMVVGQNVVSANIPAGTIITACGGSPACSSTSITLSASATATAAGTALTTTSTLPMTTVTTTNGSPTATVASYTGLIVGQTVTASGIPNGTTITACGGGTACTQASITLSANATITNVTPTAFYVAATPLSTSYINGTNGFRLDGINANDYAAAVATGDINGDGYADIVIGAYHANSNKGYVYTVFGQASAILPATTISTTSGLPSATVASYTGLTVGQTVYSANIPNGTTITACGGGTVCTSTNITLSANATATAAGTALNIATTPLNIGSGTLINGTTGFRLDGVVVNGYTGIALATGDINGDGYADILIGAYGNGSNSHAGYTYVVFGGTGPKGDPTHSWATSSTYYTSAGDYQLNLTGTGTGFINGTNGFRLDGVTAGDGLGYAVATGDVNGDGYADIIVAADGAGYSASNAGSVYVVFGGPTRESGIAWPAAGNLVMNTGGTNVINGIDGFRFDGANANDAIGSSVTTGDVNGDHTADIIIGASAGNGTYGYAYTVFGRKTSKQWPNPFPLGTWIQ